VRGRKERGDHDPLRVNYVLNVGNKGGGGTSVTKLASKKKRGSPHR